VPTPTCCSTFPFLHSFLHSIWLSSHVSSSFSNSHASGFISHAVAGMYHYVACTYAFHGVLKRLFCCTAPSPRHYRALTTLSHNARVYISTYPSSLTAAALFGCALKQSSQARSLSPLILSQAGRTVYGCWAKRAGFSQFCSPFLCHHFSFSVLDCACLPPLFSCSCLFSPVDDAAHVYLPPSPIPHLNTSSSHMLVPCTWIHYVFSHPLLLCIITLCFHFLFHASIPCAVCLPQHIPPVYLSFYLF